MPPPTEPEPPDFVKWLLWLKYAWRKHPILALLVCFALVVPVISTLWSAAERVHRSSDDGPVVAPPSAPATESRLELASRPVEDPIFLAQGVVALSFNRILKRDEFRFESESIVAIKSPLNSQRIWAAFTIQKIEPYIPPPITERGEKGERRWTQIDIRFDSSPGLIPSNLSSYSVKTFSTECDYLVYRGLRVPADVTVSGQATLVLNGSKRLHFHVPVHYFSAHEGRAIVIPLNDKARAEMDDFRMFNPSTGVRTIDPP